MGFVSMGMVHFPSWEGAFGLERSCRPSSRHAAPLIRALLIRLLYMGIAKVQRRFDMEAHVFFVPTAMDAVGFFLAFFSSMALLLAYVLAPVPHFQGVCSGFTC